MSQPYDVNGMINIAENYVNRMKDAHDKGVSGMNLAQEPLVIQLSKADLSVLNDPKCDGVYAIFALDDGGNTQSVITVPYGANGVAMKTNGVMQGIEKFPSSPIPPKLSGVLSHPNGVRAGVTDALADIGIS